MRAFWPVAEAAQADYERLREAALTGVTLCQETVRRFERAGLAGLIVRPAARAIYLASVRGAVRPAWTPYADPRRQALAASYELLLVGAGTRKAEAAHTIGPEGGRSDAS